MSQMPDREGRFRGYPVEWGLKESTGDSQSVAFACLWRLTEFYDPDGKQWCDYSQLNREITSFTYFIKRDGSPSLNGVEQLKRSLGWNGHDVAALQTTDWTARGCQLTIESEINPKNNKRSLKVQWLDEWDATPGRGVVKLDGDRLSALQGRLGGQLRASAGPQSAAAPPPKGRPAPPPPPIKVAAATEGGDVDEKDIPFSWAILIGGLSLASQDLCQIVTL